MLALIHVLLHILWIAAIVLGALAGVVLLVGVVIVLIVVTSGGNPFQ